MAKYWIIIRNVYAKFDDQQSNEDLKVILNK